jgi:2-iminoacetate synthase ThiH
VVRTEHQLDLDVHHREASQRTAGDGFAQALSTAGMNSFGITPPVMSLMNRKSSLSPPAVAAVIDSSITT